MPTLEFKGKQHIYAHHLTVPYRPSNPTKPAPATQPTRRGIFQLVFSEHEFLEIFARLNISE